MSQENLTENTSTTDTIHVYSQLPSESEQYTITKTGNLVSIGGDLPDDDLMSRILTFDITTLQPYIRYLVLYSNIYNKYLISNIEDYHIPYSGYFVDIYTISLLLTSTSNFITIWKTEANEIFFLGRNCKIVFDGYTVLEGGTLFSDWLQTHSKDPNCVTKWLASWDELKASVNQRRELMFRGLPVLDAQTDILLKIVQGIFEDNPNLRTKLETTMPEVIEQFDVIANLSLYEIKSKNAIDTILSDKEKIREIQNRYGNSLAAYLL